MSRTVAVYGAGGFGREVAWLVQSCRAAGENKDVVCFIDDDENLYGTVVNAVPVMSLIQAKEIFPSAKIISGIGVPKIREITIKKAEKCDFGFATLIHNDVVKSEWIEIGEGAVICAGSILTTNIALGKHVQINLKCTIGHDVIIRDYATLAPGVHVSGYVHIGERAYIGTGAVIINGTKDNPVIIGDDAVIGAGACVMKSIPAAETWVGVPARVIKR